MILADKITRLRKKNGWSQEDLAVKMNVSRQAVSKWEAAQATPDLEKILQLSSLFGVTTDYLLKDEIESEEFTCDIPEQERKRVTLENANAYMEHRKWASGKIALATLLCILSPICLIVLGIISDAPGAGIGENLALLGLAVLFPLVAVAVAIYLYVDFKNRPYEYLNTEAIELAYGVFGAVREKQKAFRSRYVKSNIYATCLCILAPLFLIAGALSENETVIALALSVMLFIVGIAVFLFISVGVQWASMQKLLREGEFSSLGKRKNKISEAVNTVYWLAATAIYLTWSFLTNDWHLTWIVWPVAGVLSGILTAVLNVIFEDKESDK